MDVGQIGIIDADRVLLVFDAIVGGDRVGIGPG
jgi:hypothetical protein